MPPLALRSPDIGHAPPMCATLLSTEGFLTHHSSKVLLYVEVIKSVQFEVSGSQFLGKLNSLRGGDAAPSVQSAQGAGARHSSGKKSCKKKIKKKIFQIMQNI